MTKVEQIRVKFLEDYDTFSEGDIAWLEPETAADLVEDGVAELAPKGLKKPPRDKMMHEEDVEMS